MAVFVSGSIAYDRIMDFPGKFSDHILPGKIHNLNISFGLERLSVRFGGTAGNIAYTLALLGERANIISQVGSDFGEYRGWLRRHHLSERFIRTIHSQHCATAHIITDQRDNQITAFHFGAMSYPATADAQIKRRLAVAINSSSTSGILSAGNITDMLALAKRYQVARVKYIVDPGQQLVWITPAQLRTVLRGAHSLIVNDYEWALVQKKLETTAAKLRRQLARVIVTLGEKGALWYYPLAEKKFPVVRPRRLLDPTGAGDAYRAGVIFGLVKRWPDEVAGRVAALCATYAIEHYGTQVHYFTRAQFQQRFRKNFKMTLPL